MRIKSSALQRGSHVQTVGTLDAPGKSSIFARGSLQKLRSAEKSRGRGIFDLLTFSILFINECPPAVNIRFSKGRIGKIFLMGFAFW